MGSSGATQAKYCTASLTVRHQGVLLSHCLIAGGWTCDGITLFGVIDLEGAIFRSSTTPEELTLTLRNPSSRRLVEMIAPAFPRHRWLQGLRTFTAPTSRR
jgi:hypothetical protein